MEKASKKRPGAEYAALILAALRKEGRPMSAYDLIAELGGRAELAPQTAYRALNRLIGEGTAHKLESLNAFVACTHRDHHGAPAFAVCETCGSVAEFDAPEPVARLRSWARRSGFDLRATTLELHGTCAVCRSAEQGHGSDAHLRDARSWRLS